MEYQEIKYQLENSPSLQLLNKDNAPLIISFLDKQFKENQRSSIQQSELTRKLEDYLEYIRQIEPERAYPRSAKEYINEWCDEFQLLRNTYAQNSNDFVYTLTPATEKVLKWLGELLQPPEFVSTDSRFEQIIDLLKKIRDYSTIDVKTRLEQLEEERDRIQQEIDKIKQTGVVTPYNPSKIKGLFFEANNIAKNLESDFAEVAEKFRDIIRKLQEAQLQEKTSKGSVVAHVLDADQQIKESEQGQSFYGFWNLLMSLNKQKELEELIEIVCNLDELQSVSQQNRLLSQIKDILIDKAQPIVQSNHRLAEKLRQMLDEDNLKQNRRVAQLIREIQHLAAQVAKQPPPDDEYFLVLQGKPEINLVMTSIWHPLKESQTPIFSINFADLPVVNPDEELKELYDQFYVDEKKLEWRIAQTLEHQEEVTLAELVEIYPVEQGLSEIVAYLGIASKSEQHLLNDNIEESIIVASLEPEKQLLLTLPLVIFKR